MKNEDLFYIIIGALIGLGMGFLFWHPSQNDYVSQFDYDKLERAYQELQGKYDDLRTDTANLILEYYGKNVALNFFGLKKHKIVVCVLQEHLVGEIPLIKEFC
ncbi:MAG: hypothetical protein ABIH37_01655 [archaeon]